MLNFSDTPRMEIPHAGQHQPGGDDALTGYATSNDLAVVAAKLAAGFKISQLLYSNAAGVGSGTSFTDIATQAITSVAGESVLVFGWGKINPQVTATLSVIQTECRLRRDTTDLVTPQPITNEHSAATSGGFGQPPFPMFYYDSSIEGAPGTYTYKVQGLYGGGATYSGTPTAEGAILVLALKALT